MATNLVDKQLQINAYIFIEKDEVPFVSLTLEQAFGQHHHFSVILDYDAMKKKFLSNPIAQINLIGKALTIELQQGNQGDSYQFKGIITCTANEGREGKHGNLIIEGYSPTILLERGKRWDVFDNMELRRIVEEVTDGYPNPSGHLDLINKPVFTTPVTFLMQYNESDWEFLQRLSAITGERLYYTGLELVFGRQPQEFPLREAMYDREITNIRFNTKYMPNTFTRYQYLAELNDTIEQSVKTIENANEYIDEVYRRSEVFTKNRPVRTPLGIPVDDAGALNELVMHEKVATAAQTVYVSGEIKNCRIRIGRIVTIKLPEGMSEVQELGTYRVVKVKHEIDQNHRYHGQFEAVPAGLNHTPVPELRVPAAGPVSAVVVSNQDPKGLGRIWVDFPFARERRNEVWLRVMTPDAGSSGEVARNRGMVFIPEKGDQVMVGFEFGDPNRPYVMGSLFHGKNAAGGGVNNAIKSIITKSGIKIVFNDDEKSLHIEDPSGNTWDMDGKGNMAVNAPKNMTITVGENMDVSVGKNISVSAGQDISVDAGQNISESAGGNIVQAASGDIVETADNKTEIIEKTRLQTSTDYNTTAEEVIMYSTKENMVMDSAKTVKVNSAEKANFF